MDWTKIVRNMFTNSGKDGHHTWPRSLFTSHRNHLGARKLSYQHNEKPDILRLNSVGEATPEEDFPTDGGGFVKRGILGDIPVDSANTNSMPCYNNNYHSHQAHRMGPFHQNGWFSSKRNPAENGYNFNMAQKQYRFPAFGCQPPPPWQQYGNGWAYPYWPQGPQGSVCGNPFAGNGHPMGFTTYHQGIPFIARKAGSPHRPSPKKVTRNNHSQEPNKSAKKSVPQKNNVKKQAHSGAKAESLPVVVGTVSVNSVADNLKELHITSETCDRQNGSNEDSKSTDSSTLRMHVTIQDGSAEKLQTANTETKKENIPSSQQRVCDNCKNCSSKGQCVGVGYCLLSPSSGHAKLTLILGSKENLGKLSNANGKNGYHEKADMTESNDSAELSDERVPSPKLNDLLDHDQVNASDISSSHPLYGAKPNSGDTSTPSNSRVLAPVLLQRSMCSKRRQNRPSSRKRNKDRTQKLVKESDDKTAHSKKQKVNHRDHEVPSTSQSKSKTNSTIAYILGFSPPQNSSDSQAGCSSQGAQIHCKVSVQPDKFSFTISSSDDTDFSDDDDDLVALSEDDADIWNSFNKCDDPYNPLNFLTSTCSSTPKVIPKSSSAPSLLTTENDDLWYKEPPAFSPPKPEALIRSAKKVHFATDAHMVQVHAADDWERKGPWEQMALDSKRFEDRIQRIDEAIGYIFNKEHREKIMKSLNLD